MKNKKYSILGIIMIAIAIVALSGCTDSNSTSSSGAPSLKGDYPDIKLANTPNPYLLSDKSSYMVGGLIKNDGSKTYTNVLLKINGLDSSGKVLSSKQTMISNLPPGTTADYQVFLDVPSGGQEIIGAELEVVSANQS